MPGRIATHYQVAPLHVDGPTIGGFRALPVADLRDPGRELVAVQTEADCPPRARIIAARAGLAVPHAMLPVDLGAGAGIDPNGPEAWFIICPAPPGPSLAAERHTWREAELIACVLLPAAATLGALAAKGLTHRAIRPDNLFRPGPAEPITLGPFWAAPPALHQPTIFEPRYSAWCAPNARGDGSIADDVYALGVALLVLASGLPRLALLDPAAILRRKLELGSFAALVADTKLPPLIADLLRGMLADEPDHRPSPALLLEPEQARTRRIAARPASRAPSAVDVSGTPSWTARDLAAALAAHPERGFTLLQAGTVDRWLRRSLGDSPLAGRLEEAIGRRGSAAEEGARHHAMTVMRAVAVLDPLAPLVWRGVALWPDGLSTALASAGGELAASLEEIVIYEVVAHWAALHPKRRDVATLHQDAREWRGWHAARGAGGGTKRVIYGMNPLLACASPLLAGRKAPRLIDLLPALEAAAAGHDRRQPPIDGHIVSFVAARADPSLQRDLPSLDGTAAASQCLGILRLYAKLQTRLSSEPLPQLASWLVESGMFRLDRWRSRTLREGLSQNLVALAQRGEIAPMLALVEDDTAQIADRQAAAAAAARRQTIGLLLHEIEIHTPARALSARSLGYEIAAGIGLLGTIGAALSLALG